MVYTMSSCDNIATLSPIAISSSQPTKASSRTAWVAMHPVSRYFWIVRSWDMSRKFWFPSAMVYKESGSVASGISIFWPRKRSCYTEKWMWKVYWVGESSRSEVNKVVFSESFTFPRFLSGKKEKSRLRYCDASTRIATKNRKYL